VNRVFRITVIVFTLVVLASSTPAFAQRRGAPFRARAVFVGGYFYDPFFGPYPWWAPAAYPYGYYPAYYPVSIGIRLEVKPKHAEVYVDGYYAGIVDDFNGFFQRLRIPPGEHDLTLYLEGYRTIHQHVNLSPRSGYKARYVLLPLPAGETSEKPPAPPPVPAPPAGTYALPRTPYRTPLPPGSPTPPPPGAVTPLPPVPMTPASPSGATVGTIVVQVQPTGADVLIDGERWTSSDAERLVVQVSAGRHHLEIRKSGYRSLSTDINVRGGVTTPLNFSLIPE
jgi:PEGA domain-containing protein